MKVELAASFTKGHDEYPDTLDKAIGYLDMHKLDAAYKEYKKQQRDSKEDRKPKASRCNTQPFHICDSWSQMRLSH
jgi:hypothetical protein